MSGASIILPGDDPRLPEFNGREVVLLDDEGDYWCSGVLDTDYRRVGIALLLCCDLVVVKS